MNIFFKLLFSFFIFPITTVISVLISSSLNSSFFISVFTVYSITAPSAAAATNGADGDGDSDDTDAGDEGAEERPDSVEEEAELLPVLEAKSLALAKNPDWKWDEGQPGCKESDIGRQIVAAWEANCLIEDDDNSCTEDTEDKDCQGGEVCVDEQCVSVDEVEPIGVGPCNINALSGVAGSVQLAECCMTGMACETRIRRAVNDAEENCKKFKEKAENCCYDPASCLPGGEVAGQIANVAGQVHGASGDSMSETCKKLKQSFTGFSSINAFMAANCKSKARKCISKCNEGLNDIDDAFRDACGVSIDPDRSWKDSFKCTQDVYEYQYAYERLEDIPDECREVSKESNRQSAQVATQLVGLLTTAKACKLKLADEKPPEPTPCTFGCPTCMECVEGMCKPKQCGPCEVCMAGNGACMSICIEGQTCNDQGRCGFDTSTTGGTDDPIEPGIKNPVLGAISDGAGGGGSLTNESGLSRELSNESGPGGGPFQESDFDLTDGVPGLKPGQAGSVGGLLGGGGGGSGGGLGGGGSGGGGGGGSGGGYGGGGGEDDASPNDILQGFQSGKFGGYGGKGGHKGYGKAPKGGRGKKGKNKKKRKQAKLDLKNLMPKDKKLDNARGKFGSIHDNIFQRISNRVQILCRKDKMNCR